MHTVPGYRYEFISGVAPSERTSYRACRHEADALCCGVVFHMSVPCKYHIHPILLEQGDILCSLFLREIEVIVVFIDILEDYRAVRTVAS